MSLVTQSITEPGEYSSGMAVQETRQWRRNAARLRQLDELARRVIQLEKAAPGAASDASTKDTE
jgi:UDP-3-O-[3-hydroxymyristoyl] glucosamine N-acyltransferase